jgi:hypothetical protein
MFKICEASQTTNKYLGGLIFANVYFFPLSIQSHAFGDFEFNKFSFWSGLWLVLFTWFPFPQFQLVLFGFVPL